MGWDWLYNPIAPIRDISKAIGGAFKGGDSGKGSSAPAPAPAPLPEAPKPEAAAEKAQEQVRRRKSAQTQTVFTDPLGVAGQADIVRKTLTGQ